MWVNPTRPARFAMSYIKDTLTMPFNKLFSSSLHLDSLYILGLISFHGLARNNPLQPRQVNAEIHALACTNMYSSILYELHPTIFTMSPVFKVQTKHTEVYYHFIRELLNSKSTACLFVQVTKMLISLQQGWLVLGFTISLTQTEDADSPQQFSRGCYMTNQGLNSALFKFLFSSLTSLIPAIHSCNFYRSLFSYSGLEVILKPVIKIHIYGQYKREGNA